MSLTNTPFNPVFDIPLYVGQRALTFSFELIDGITGLHMGQLHPLTEPTPTLSHDTARTIKRQVSLSLDIADTAEINPITARVLINAVLPSGETFPLGRYMFIDSTKIITSTGDFMSATLVDEMFIIDQPLEESFSPALAFLAASTLNGVSVEGTIRQLLRDVRVEYDIDSSGFTTQSSWPAGTSRAKVLQDLCLQGGYFNPWFDNSGVLQVRTVVDPANVVPDFDLDSPPRVFMTSITYANDLVTAPNRFIVISNTGNEDTPRVGRYDVPSSAPHSIANRGFVVPSVRDMQLTNVEQATAVARAIGIQSTVFERTELSTPVDPRFDSYDVVTWLGVPWLEIGWAMELAGDGSMRHSLRKAYS